MNSNVMMKQESKPGQSAEFGEGSSQRERRYLRSFGKGSTARAASGLLTAPPRCGALQSTRRGHRTLPVLDVYWCAITGISVYQRHPKGSHHLPITCGNSTHLRPTLIHGRYTFAFRGGGQNGANAQADTSKGAASQSRARWLARPASEQVR
jgi:hypothetical protein